MSGRYNFAVARHRWAISQGILPNSRSREEIADGEQAARRSGFKQFKGGWAVPGTWGNSISDEEYKSMSDEDRKGYAFDEDGWYQGHEVDPDNPRLVQRDNGEWHEVPGLKRVKKKGAWVSIAALEANKAHGREGC